MAGKKEKVFMTTNNTTVVSDRYLIMRLIWLLLMVLLIFLDGCQPSLSDDAIPYQPFGSVVLNLSLPSYQKLNAQGYDYYDGAGVRGLIIYRESSTNYIAYERNCTYHPNDACATVNIDVSGLYLQDPCCGSSFRLSDGSPMSGAAWRPLRRYVTSVSGNVLTITDQIAN
jgi:hypothetical protein